MKLQVKDILDTANARDIYVTITNDAAIPLLDCDTAVLECEIKQLYANMNDVVLSISEDEFIRLRDRKYKSELNKFYGKCVDFSSCYPKLNKKSSN